MRPFNPKVPQTKHAANPSKKNRLQTETHLKSLVNLGSVLLIWYQIFIGLKKSCTSLPEDPGWVHRGVRAGQAGQSKKCPCQIAPGSIWCMGWRLAGWPSQIWCWSNSEAWFLFICFPPSGKPLQRHLAESMSVFYTIAQLSNLALWENTRQPSNTINQFWKSCHETTQALSMQTRHGRYLGLMQSCLQHCLHHSFAGWGHMIYEKMGNQCPNWWVNHQGMKRKASKHGPSLWSSWRTELKHGNIIPGGSKYKRCFSRQKCQLANKGMDSDISPETYLAIVWRDFIRFCGSYSFLWIIFLSEIVLSEYFLNVIWLGISLLM